MATKKAEVSVTCNIRQPRQAQKILVTALENLRKEYEKLVAAGKQNDSETQKLKKDMDALASAVDTNKQNMSRVKKVMDDLSGSTLKQLNAALREVKRQLSGKSSNSADLAKMQSQYAAITEQIKKLKGEAADIARGLRSVSSQSDAWLSKAIARQKELVAETRRGTQEYLAQNKILKLLKAEQNTRSNRAIQSKGNAAMALAANPAKASMVDLRSARQDLLSYRDNIGKNGINLGSASQNASAIKQINDMLKAIDAQIDSINGKEQRVALSARQIVQSVRQIDFSKASPAQLKTKLDEVNNALANMAKNDPMRSQLLQSANTLRAALDSLEGRIVNVRGVLANLDKASPRLLQSALDQVNKELNKMGQNDPRRQKLIADADKLRAALNRVRNVTVDVQKVLNNIKGSSLNDLRKAAAQLEQEMSKLDRAANADKIKKLREQIRQLNDEIARGTKNLSQHESGWKKTFKAITAYMGVTMIISKVQQTLTKLTNLNLKFSDQLADIRKVSGLAMEDINALASRLASIDTRSTIEELNHIAYAGAKLGIGKYGVEGLEGFVRAANQVNVALKEDLGEDALTALSKITEVMGLIPKMGVEKSMLATGSAMFQLSATSTATANNIVEFAKRLTGLAKVTGITTDQLLGLGSASDSMFLAAEVSATAFNKLFTSLQTKHNLIEKELAIEPGTISQLYSAGRAMDAIVLIFEKMKEKGNMNALQDVFKDLGSDGARLVNVMVTMSQNVNMLKEHLQTSSDAFEEASAVTNEYNIQQETAQALMERASNLWEKAFINPDGVDNVKGLAKAWYDVSAFLTENVVVMTGAKTVLWAIITAVKALCLALPVLINFLLFKGVWASLVLIKKGFDAVRDGTLKATLAQHKLNAAQKANVFIALASIILTVVMALIDYSKAADKAALSQEKLNEYLDEAEANYDKEKRKLDSYISVLEDVNTSTAQRLRILKKFHSEYDSYLEKLGIEVNNVDDLKSAYADLNAEIKKKMYYQIREKAYDSELGPAAARIGKALRSYSDYTMRNPRLSAYDTKWLQDQLDGGRFYKSIFDNLVKVLYGGGGKFSRGLQWYYDANNKAHYTKELFDILKENYHAVQDYKVNKNSIDNALNPVIGDYNPASDVELGDLGEDAPDKDAIKEAQRAKQEKLKKLRAQLKDSQDEARAVIDNIINFYQRQITEVLRVANEQQWDEALIESATDAILAREHLALSQARKGIAGVATEWNDFKQTMQNDMIETADEVGYNESRILLDLITQTSLEALHNKINGLARDLELPANAATDAIWKNATLDEKANETAEQRHLRERQKILLADNYTAKVDSDYSASMSRLGYFDVNETQAQTLVAGGEDAAALLDRRNKEIAAVFKNAREHLIDLIDIEDVSTDEGRNRLLDLIFGPDWSQDRSELKEVFSLVGDDLRMFLDELIKYDNDYIEAQKKAEDRAMKLADFQWSHSSRKNDLDKKQRVNDLYAKGLLQHAYPDEAQNLPAYGVYGNARFASDFGADPELEAYRIKIKTAQFYYELLKALGIEGQQLADRQQAVMEAQAAYAEHLASRLKQQMEYVLSLHAPIEDFGSKVGEAFATMTEDAEAGRKALKAAIGDMINSFMKQTVEMTKEYVKRSIMQKAHDRLMQAQIKKETKAETALEDKKQDQLLDVQQLGGEAKEQLVTIFGQKMQKATQKVGQESLQLQQAQTGQEIQTESAKTEANVTMGIASGASKIIGSLGWWGIPLVAVITALLNGLLSFAMSKVSSLFGGGTSSDTADSSKLVSGMLTYDSGNVQAFRGVEDGKTYPVVGSDGKVYAAKDGGELSTGLVKDPITTLVNGQPALVAERGPEMVIGRETTAAMMMARPDILAEIVKFDRLRSGRSYRAFDTGNLDDFPISPSQASALAPQDISRLRDTIDSLALVLSAIQKDGIPAHINKYGRGGVTDAARSGSKFMQRNSSDPLWRN